MAGFTRRDLENKIKEIYGINTISHLIDTQITNYVRNKGYTFLEIARALAYHFIINEGDISKANGIGIVPYVMEDARRYFAQEAARVQAQIKQAEEYKAKGNNTIVCQKRVKKPQRKKPFIDIGEIGVDNNG